MTNIVPMKRPPKSSRTEMDTLILTRELIATWKIPPFQRPLKINEKVRSIAQELEAEGGVISGVVTLGMIDDSKKNSGVYVVDGQHRLEAFKLSGLKEGLVDVRIIHFADMAEMGEEFVQLNSAIVRIRPDDVLRGLEQSIPALIRIRTACEIVGYDLIRRGAVTPVLSMSLTLRAWMGSGAETPVLAPNAAQLAKAISPESTTQLINFLQLALAAWGRDVEYHRLWGALNLTLCMWLYRRLVLEQERGVKRYAQLKPDHFRRCLMSLSTNQNHLDWLLGRHMSERDRSPCYQRLKIIFSRRLTDDGVANTKMPQPPWSASR